MKEDVEHSIDLKQELEEFKEILYTHVRLLNSHLEHFKQHEEQEKSQFNEVICKLNESCENTKGLVELWNAGAGTIKMLSIVGAIIKWISGIAIGVGSIWLLLHGQIPTDK